MFFIGDFHSVIHCKYAFIMLESVTFLKLRPLVEGRIELGRDCRLVRDFFRSLFAGHDSPRATVRFVR